MSWKLLNAFCYQVVWIVCVAGAAHRWPAAGLIATALFVALVLGFGGSWRADLRFLPAALACGLLFDSAWIAMGWIDYSAPWPSQSLSPPWILCIWTAFAMTFNHSLSFLKQRYALASLFGAIAGPFAYWGAEHGMGAVRFQAPTAVVLGGLCVAWAVVLPVLVRIAELRSPPPMPEPAA